jgi:malate permease and related proteins
MFQDFIDAFARMLIIILPIFIIIGIGMGVRRLRWLDNAGITTRQATTFLNTLVLNLTLPAVVFTGLTNVERFELSLLKIPLIAYVVIAVSTILAFLMTRKLNFRRETAGAFILSGMCGSTAFFGYPIFTNFAAEKGLGLEHSVGYTALYSEIGTLIPLVTASVLIASRYGEGKAFSWRDAVIAIFRFAPFIWLVISFLFWQETHRTGGVPAIFKGTLDIMRNATIFLIMLSLGLTITTGDILQYWKSTLLLNAIKLVVAPVIALILCYALRLERDQFVAVVVNSAVPCILLSISYANQYKLDVAFASTAVFSSFFLSLLTLPIFYGLASAIAR